MCLDIDSERQWCTKDLAEIESNLTSQNLVTLGMLHLLHYWFVVLYKNEDDSNNKSSVSTCSRKLYLRHYCDRQMKEMHFLKKFTAVFSLILLRDFLLASQLLWCTTSPQPKFKMNLAFHDSCRYNSLSQLAVYALQRIHLQCGLACLTSTLRRSWQKEGNWSILKWSFVHIICLSHFCCFFIYCVLFYHAQLQFHVPVQKRA